MSARTQGFIIIGVLFQIASDLTVLAHGWGDGGTTHQALQVACALFMVSALMSLFIKDKKP